jgi:hypothetical protein
MGLGRLLLGGVLLIGRHQVLRYEIEPGAGAHAIRFHLHGTYCGKTGPEPCSKRHTIGTRRFELKAPR